MKRTLLALFADRDDEVFGAGGHCPGKPQPAQM